ncbi:MAG TPA: SDR family oxidoreductase [Steroidobacteraceae bacterium]|nr:SDR family oxidoreductase [Steroidobacteraceae bacterium]
MKILVTGSDGYIGSRLSPILLAAGHDVTGLDSGLYRDGWLYTTRNVRLVQPTLNIDLRDVTPRDFEGFEAVVHLAELSNDPLGQNDPKVTEAINFEGSARLARIARDAGVRRFVYASSCSVYGMATQEWVDETSATNPQTAYARCKVMVENALRPMASPDFCVTSLRNATAYGASPRLRFDIVLNDLCAVAWTAKRIVMTSDGTPWRPIVHVEDICQAVTCALDSPVERVNGEVMNVGGDEENYRIRDLAAIVAETFPGCEVTVGSSAGDNRSYRVSFRKIRERMPAYRTQWNARRGAQELYELFKRIDMPQDIYKFRAFTRLKQLQYLIRTGQVDADLRWKY